MPDDSPRRKIGEYDWYREGAKHLVDAVGTTGLRSSWQGSGHAEDNQDTATSLALLFLSKGRWPVLMAKVQYGPQTRPLRKDLDWNRHRNDVNNLTMYVESKWRRELTWQVIDLDKASVDDLLQVPVLFFSGGGNPLPDERRSKRSARNWPPTSATTSTAAASFLPTARAAPAISTSPSANSWTWSSRSPSIASSRWTASHPIWIADEKIPSEQVRLLLGIDYGCRTSVVYAPSNPPGDPKPSLACLWELSRGGQRATYSPAVQEKIQGGLAIGINVLAYATNREFKEKDLIPATVVEKGPVDKIDRGKFAIAILQHPGGCDAAPRALANLMEQASHELNIRVETHPKLIGMQDPALFDYAVVFMHGRNAFRLTDGERQALRDLCRAGRAVVCRRHLRQRGLCRIVPPRNGHYLSQEPLGEHPAPRPDLDEQVRRFRSDDRHAPRPAAGQAGRAVEVGPAPRSARAEGRSFRRPLRGDLLGVRSELCPGEARFDGLPRLHPRRRRRSA